MIALDRSISYIITEVVCMLFGVGAVLMSSDYPVERIHYASGDAHARPIIEPVMVSEMFGYPMPAAYAPVPDNTPAVAIYTSGSTGNPKGILHDQKSMYCVCMRNCGLLDPVPEDVQGLVAPFTFIAGCACILYPLTAGASEIIIPKDVITNPQALASFIDQWGITMAFMPPKVFGTLQNSSRRTPHPLRQRDGSFVLSHGMDECPLSYT